MNGDTGTVLIKRENGTHEAGSSVFGVSIRGWLAFLLVATVCLNQILVVAACLWHAIQKGDFSLVGTYTTVGEPLYSMGATALGFYLGQKVSPNGNGKPT